MSKQVIEQEVLGQVLGPLADNERLKRESKNLRGTIEQDLQEFQDNLSIHLILSILRVQVQDLNI